MQAHAHAKTRKEAWEREAQKSRKSRQANTRQTTQKNVEYTHTNGMRHDYQRQEERERDRETRLQKMYHYQHKKKYTPDSL